MSTTGVSIILYPVNKVIYHVLVVYRDLYIFRYLYWKTEQIFCGWICFCSANGGLYWTEHHLTHAEFLFVHTVMCLK